MISVGIDVSKGKSMVCIMKPHGKVLKTPYEMEHIKEGLTELIRIIKSYDDETKVIVENTGYYHMPIVMELMQNGIFVSVVNALLMKKFASATIRKGKTDRIDSIRIAEYGISYWYDLEPYRPSSEVYDELNTLARQYYQYINMKVKAKITLNSLLDKTMPGITAVLRDNPNSFQKDKLCSFVKEYWHYDNITKKSESVFVNSYLRWTKREGFQPSESKAKTIYALALGGIPTLNANTPSTKMLVLESVRVLQEIERTVITILTYMQALAKSLSEYPVVRAMNGVGEKLAPRLIAEIGDITRFHSAKALVAFAGIDAPPYQSGTFSSSKCSISKRGSKYLRRTGYEIMQGIKSIKPTKDAAVYEFILKKEAEGKPKKVAKIAGFNKFLHIYYARVLEAYQS